MVEAQPRAVSVGIEPTRSLRCRRSPTRFDQARRIRGRRGRDGRVADSPISRPRRESVGKEGSVPAASFASRRAARERQARRRSSFGDHVAQRPERLRRVAAKPALELAAKGFAGVRRWVMLREAELTACSRTLGVRLFRHRSDRLRRPRLVVRGPPPASALTARRGHRVHRGRPPCRRGQVSPAVEETGSGRRRCDACAAGSEAEARRARGIDCGVRRGFSSGSRLDEIVHDLPSGSLGNSDDARDISLTGGRVARDRFEHAAVVGHEPPAVVVMSRTRQHWAGARRYENGCWSSASRSTPRSCATVITANPAVRTFRSRSIR